MADRYWVGGTGTWDATSTANWSATSGGASGASAPTASDNVIIDSNSGTGTISSTAYPDCLNFTATASQAISFAASSGVRAYGDVTFPSGGSASFTNFAPSVRGTTDSSMTTNGKVLGGFENRKLGTAVFTFNDAVDVGASYIAPTSGTLNTNNVSITCGYIQSGGTQQRALNLGSSTITASATNAVTFTGSNFTFDAGTSTLNCTNTSITFGGLGKTFYNVNFTGGGTGTTAIYGANTFNNFSVTANAAGRKFVTFDSNVTINGTLSTPGTTSSNHIFMSSNTFGTPRTLSVATMGSLDYVEWNSITLTGAASPWTAPANNYDRGYVTGIVFTINTLYWVGGAGTWDQTTTTRWATSSGGAGGAGVPAFNTNVIIDSNSGTGTIVLSGSSTYMAQCNNLTVTTANALALGISTTTYLQVNGNLSFPSGGSFSTSSWIYFVATTTGKTITSNGKSLARVSFTGVGGEWTLSDAMTISAQVYFNAGTVNFGSYSHNLGWVTNDSNGVRVLNLQSSTISASTMWQPGSSGSSNLTVNPGTSTINAGQFMSYGTAYYTVGGNSLRILDTLTTTNLVSTGGGTAPSITLSANVTVTGTFTTSSASVKNRIRVLSGDYTTGTIWTITAAAVSLANTDFYNITAAGAATWSGTSIGNLGGNTGITFTTPKNVYIVSASTPVDCRSQTVFSTTSGGATSAANYPLPQDTVYVDNNSVPSGGTITGGTSGNLAMQLNCTNRTNPVNLNFYYYDGDLTGTNILSPAVTLSSQSSQYTGTIGAFRLNQNGGTVTAFFNLIGIGASFTLDSDLTTTGNDSTYGAFQSSSSYGYAQTLDLNGYNFNVIGPVQLTTTNGKFAGPGTLNTSSINGGSGTFFRGTSLAAVPTVASVNSTYSGTSARTAVGGNNVTGANPNITFSAGGGTVSGYGGFGSLTFTSGFSGTFSPSGYWYLSGSLSISSTTTIASSTNALQFNATSGVNTITTNGKTIDLPLTFSGVGGAWQLADNLTVGSTRTISLVAGTLDTNNKTVTSGVFESLGSAVRTLTLGSTVWSVASTGNVWNLSATNLTFNPGTSEIILSSTSTTARSFSGGGNTYNKVTIGGATGTSTTTINQSNTFATLASTKVVAHTISITSGTTQTIGNWAINGTAGNVVTLGSTSTTNHTLIYTGGGIVTADYMSISRSTGSPSLTWLATNSTNGGNNSGWYFGSFPKGNTLLFGSNF